MTTVNSTADETQNTVEELYCSAELTAEIHEQLTFISVLNIFGSITAFLGNTLILAALRKESSLHPPSKLLLSNLATTDLCVGLILEPVTVISLMSVVNEQRNICLYLSIAGFVIGAVLFAVSLLTLTAISVDRLLALLLGLRYRQVVTLKRAYLIVVTFWVMTTALTGMSFWNPPVAFWYMTVVVSFSLATSIFSYTRIYFGLRHHQNQVHDSIQQPNSNQGDELNLVRYRKAVSSALWLQFTLVACFLPRGIALGLLTKTGLSPFVFLVNQYTIAIVYLNSSLNPILYCWKIDEVRQVVKGTIRQVSENLREAQEWFKTKFGNLQAELARSRKVQDALEKQNRETFKKRDQEKRKVDEATEKAKELMRASRMTISKFASDVAENHWETKGMKHALQAERDYNLMTTQKLERLKESTARQMEGLATELDTLRRSTHR